MRSLFQTTVAIVFIGALPLLAAAEAVNVPAAIYTDPIHDAEFPASMTVLHIPTHGVQINGIAYVPVGRGPHPVLVICHGQPGNEKNLDLAQAVRRAGWVAVTFNYRGSWGSPGTYSLVGRLDDAASVLAYLRDPHNSASLRLDPKRIAIAGHSGGGMVAAQTAAHDSALLGALLISVADPARPMTHEARVKFMADNMESLAGVTPESMAAEHEAHNQEIALSRTVTGLKNKPVLVLSSDDGLAPGSEALVAAIRASGGQKVVYDHVATDHDWSDRRIELEARTIRWLQSLTIGQNSVGATRRPDS